MSDNHNAEASKRLDDMAREAGIQIQRYQNPLDMSKTHVATNPLEITKLSRSPSDQLVREVDSSDNGIKSMNDQGLSGHQNNFKALLGTSKLSAEHQLPKSTPNSVKSSPHPVNHKNKSTTQTTKPAPSQPTPVASRTVPPSTKPAPSATNTSQSIKKVAQNDEAEFSIESKKSKAAEFYELIDTKLVPELSHYQSKRESTARTLHDLEQLIETINGLKLAHKAGQKTTECKVNLGCKVLAEAKFVNTGKIIVDLGLGIFTELPYNDALEAVKNRCAHLQHQLANYEKQCCLFSSRIKGMHEAIGVLTEITEGPEERMPLRDVWAQ